MTPRLLTAEMRSGFLVALGTALLLTPVAIGLGVDRRCRRHRDRGADRGPRRSQALPRRAAGRSRSAPTGRSTASSRAGSLYIRRPVRRDGRRCPPPRLFAGVRALAQLADRRRDPLLGLPGRLKETSSHRSTRNASLLPRKRPASAGRFLFVTPFACRAAGYAGMRRLWLSYPDSARHPRSASSSATCTRRGSLASRNTRVMSDTAPILAGPGP